jgi:hypothetical protein
LVHITSNSLSGEQLCGGYSSKTYQMNKLVPRANHRHATALEETVGKKILWRMRAFKILQAFEETSEPLADL